MTALRSFWRLIPAAGALVLLTAAAAAAQGDPQANSVPGPPVTGPLNLTLEDAIARGLATNLAVLLEQDRVENAQGDHLHSESALLPHLSGGASETREVLSTTAFGFDTINFPGIPNLIGPFNVFDARLSLSVPLLNFNSLSDLHASSAKVTAEQATLRNERQLVMLGVAGLYLDALAGQSRVEAARAQTATATSLSTLATDQRAAGLVPAIDAIRQQVELQSARQRQIAAENAFAKQKLALARAIGLAPDQAFDLADHLIDTALPAPSFQAAMAQAYAARDDLRSAEAEVAAARATRHADVALHLPSVQFNGDYGVIGSTPSDAAQTFTAIASLHVPIFEGGEARAKVQQADADLKARESELASLRAGIGFDVQQALLDIATAMTAVDVAKSAQQLASDELTQAQDRFRAGVATSVELVQAQDAVSAASDNFIASLYARSLAQAELARATGAVETSLSRILGGRIP